MFPALYRGNLGVYNVYNTRIDGTTGATAAAGAAESGGADGAAPAKRGWFGGWFGGSKSAGGEGRDDRRVIDPRNNMPVVGPGSHCSPCHPTHYQPPSGCIELRGIL
jgi:hypothetical protein